MKTLEGHHVHLDGLMARAMAQSGAAWGQLMFEGENAELGLVLSAMNLLPGVLAGLVLAAVLAAICSTADSQLVVAASAAASDFYARLFGGSGKRSNLIANRVVVLALGLGAILLVMDQDVKVYEYVLEYGWAILGAAFGPQMVLLLFWRRASYVGCVLGMLTGFVVAIAWKLGYNPAEGSAWYGVEIYNLPLAFAAAFVVNVVVSLITPAYTVDALERRGD